MLEKRKMLIIAITSVMVLILAIIGGYYWFNNTFYVSTDDAKVDCDLISVSPQMSGKLLEFDYDEGDSVVANQILGRLDIPVSTDTTLAAISTLDQALIRAPIDGVIIKKQANVGEIVAAGSAVATMIDPKKLFITANIEETKLGKLKTGQKVDVTIDQFGSKKFAGRVQFIGLASNDAFSLLPSSLGGTFTKVVEKIPVKINIDYGNTSLLPGTNAVVKIHIK